MDYDAFREFLALTARWAMADSPASPDHSSADLSRAGYASYYATFTRRKAASASQTPHPADHDFMRRLFHHWRSESECESERGSGSGGGGGGGNGSGLSLQNVASGLARLKGSRDILATINYFFDLFADGTDEHGNAVVDREGIIRMSEALLFLSRRGFEGLIVQPDAPPPPPQQQQQQGNGSGSLDEPPYTHFDREHGDAGVKMTVEERFLGSVSDFIRRCFEYADPSRQAGCAEGEKRGQSGTETEVGLVDSMRDLSVSAGVDQAGSTDDLLDLTEDAEADEEQKAMGKPGTQA
ncbi:TBC1 domain member 9, partial [Ascosphaera acerosa]